MSAKNDSVLIWELPNFKIKNKWTKKEFFFSFHSSGFIEEEVFLQQPQTKKSPQYNEAQQSKTGNSECIFPLIHLVLAFDLPLEGIGEEI